MPSAAKGAVLIMSEKKTSGIKNFFEEFKAFAMRGNVLDMAVGVVVGSAFTAIVNSLVNDIAIKAVRCPHCTSKLEGFPEAKL